MAYLIVKPTRREAEQRRREGLAKAGLSPKRYRGTARTAEEAHDTQRALEREGETFDKLWEVSGDSPEAKQAEQDELLKAGINPETKERLHG
ncbi:hypothetical protein LCGC14_0859370 [marine sediment metagenome]|uniref:Uncharacterized protein n=1 Tax=marine sediment metagenome TaxID=412755 RepID=A0A0F9PT73_9ZZZZ